MRVAYFTNRYPAVSHTFIRREIVALERLGVAVRRITLRAEASEKLVDAEDRAERDATLVLLDASRVSILARILREIAARPIGALRVLAWSRCLARHSRLPLRKMLAYWAEAVLLRPLVADCDALRVHFGTNGAVVARLLRRLGGPPYSIVYHGPDEFDAPGRWDIGGTVADAAFVNAISHYGAAQLMRWSAPADWPRIRVVRCSVDDRFFDAPPLPAGPLRLCTVARLAPQKGLTLLIDALGDIADADETSPMLDVVGDGPLLPALEMQVEARGLGRTVRFLGARDGAGVRQALAEAHVFILPSFAEGLPVVIMEALAGGRPVIASAIAGTGELVRAGRNGWLVAAGDRAGLVDCIRAAMATDRPALEALAAAGREDVRARHSDMVNAQALLDLLEQFGAQPQSSGAATPI